MHSDASSGNSLKSSAEHNEADDLDMEARVWIFKRNCSLSPRQLLVGYLCLCGLTLTVAIGFLIAGYWIVLPFAGLELLIVGLAFVIWGRHATDCEMIEVSPNKLRITVTSGARVSHIDLAAQWTRVEYHGRFREPLVFVCRDRRVGLGRFIAEKDKPAVQRELRLALRQVAFTG